MMGLKGVPAQYGGVERMVEEVGARLAARGHEVTVYCRTYYTPPVSTHRGMRIVRLPSHNSKYTDTLSHTLISTMDVMRRGVDVVHYHSLGPSVFSSLPRLRGIKTVVQVHGLEWTDDKWAPWARAGFRVAERLAMRLPNVVASDGKTWKEYLERKYHRPVAFITNGVSLADPGLPCEILSLGLRPRKYVLYVGRLVQQKGCHYLIQAYRRLKTEYPLVFAGGSTHSDGYVGRLKMLAAGDERIRFVGFVQGRLLSELFSNACLCVVPSDAEGQAVTLVEAMGYGNCVVASDIPENLEALGDYGYSFKAGDSDDLCRVLESLLARPELVEAKRGGARHHVEQNYTWDIATDQAEQLYRRLLADNAK